MPSAVTIKRLKKVVGGKSILKSIDLAVRPGEFLTLVGPSGCGKSTLLRVISGLTEFTSGSVLIMTKRFPSLHLANAVLQWCFNLMRSIRI